RAGQRGEALETGRGEIRVRHGSSAVKPGCGIGMAGLPGVAFSGGSGATIYTSTAESGQILDSE
ncbi:MAG: hypothetical protein ACTHKD_02480, partial [Devosia sp.]